MVPQWKPRLCNMSPEPSTKPMPSNDNKTTKHLKRKQPKTAITTINNSSKQQTNILGLLINEV